MATAPPNAPRHVVGPIREFLTLRRAEETVRAYPAAAHERIRTHFRAAERRLFAAKRLAMGAVHGVSAAGLLRDAVAQYLFAIDIARRAAEPGAEAHADAPPAALDLGEAMPELPPEPADTGRPVIGMTDDARVRAALASRDALYFDRLSPEDVERSRWALERAASMLRRRVEPRTLPRLRLLRAARLVAAGVASTVALVATVRAATAPVDIARGKPVRPSSYHVNPPDGHELVDGEIGTSFGVHTNIEDNANVVIDLIDTYRVTTVKVYNRVDGWFDDILPVLVEVSIDGTTYKEIGRREEHFGTSPPWIIDARARSPQGEPARYVRVRVPRRGYIALSEVEVFGKKM
jgi:hypothetical protein